jgi:hypothetical protein
LERGGVGGGGGKSDYKDCFRSQKLLLIIKDGKTIMFLKKISFYFSKAQQKCCKNQQFKCRVLFQPFSKQHHNGKKKCLLENAMEEKIKQILLLRLDLTILQCLNDRIFSFHCCNEDSYLCFVFSSH